MKTPLSGALLACLVFGATAPAHAEPQDLMNKAGCLACHHKEKKLVGPALSTVAARYKSQGPDVATALMQKVRTGSKGVYGPIPMPPSAPDKISDADLKTAIDWILTL